MYVHGMGTDNWTMWCSITGLIRSKSNVAVHPHRTTAYCHIHNTHKHTLTETYSSTYTKTRVIKPWVSPDSCKDPKRVEKGLTLSLLVIIIESFMLITLAN